MTDVKTRRDSLSSPDLQLSMQAIKRTQKSGGTVPSN